MEPFGFRKHLEGMGVSGSSRVLVAVSGGMDSMSLLHALHTAPLELKCTAAHVNFHLRGAESDADQALVEGCCKEQGIPCRVKQAQTLHYAREHAVSMEMAAREIRYAWFEELMGEGEFDFLAIAHNADDNAETLILNLVRGTGVKGLCGIAAQRGTVIRPLLRYTRQEIEKYVSYFKVPYRTDHTNLESDFARNRVRNEVFPQLKQINPSLIQTLNKNIRHFSMAWGMLEKVVAEEKKRLWKTDAFPEKGKVEIAGLLALEYWPFVLYELLQEYGFNAAQVADVEDSILDTWVQKVFSKGYVLVKERGWLKLYDVALAEAVEPVVLSEVGVYLFAGKHLSLEWMNPAPDLLQKLSGGESGTLVVSADAIQFPLVCRPMQAGDKFIPFGMKGAKKVSDFLTDLKLDHILRHRIPVLLNGAVREGNKNPGGDVICLPGFRIDSRYKVTTNTNKILIIKVF